MKPTGYVLFVEKGMIYLRGIAPETTLKGYFNVEALPYDGGDCLPGLRKDGARLAKRNGVEFVDRTGAAQC